MLRLIFFILLAHCSIQSFSQLNKAESQISIVNLAEGFNNNQKIPLSKIANFIKYIPLETTNDNYISQIKKIVIEKNCILVLDEKANKLLLFNLDGHYQCSIGREGKGPGEYVRITNIEVSPSRNLIYIFDVASAKILTYNFEGEFMGNLRHPLLGYWVTLLDDKYFVYFDPARSYRYAGGFYKAIITDLNGKIVKKFLRQSQSKEEKFKSPCSMQSYAYSYNNSSFYWEVTSDTIFQVTETLEFFPSRYVNQGPMSLPKSKMYEARYVMEKFSEHSTILTIFETEKFFFARGITNFQPAALLYFKDSKECYNASNSRGFLINDLDNGPGFWPIGKINDHSIYSAIDPIDLKDIVSNNKEMQITNSEVILKMANSLQEIDNPIIVILELKN